MYILVVFTMQVLQKRVRIQTKRACCKIDLLKKVAQKKTLLKGYSSPKGAFFSLLCVDSLCKLLLDFYFATDPFAFLCTAKKTKKVREDETRTRNHSSVTYVHKAWIAFAKQHPVPAGGTVGCFETQPLSETLAFCKNNCYYEYKLE